MKTNRPAGGKDLFAETADLLNRYAERISDSCVQCPKCAAECAFLARHGTPKTIVDKGDFADPDFLVLAYACSLCGLCEAVCPVGLTPQGLFLEMRRAAVRSGTGPLKQHAPILNYERRGTSKRYTYYSLPHGCRTVLFPGCTLPGTRRRQTIRLYECLQRMDPEMGIVLDCCSKPSHDLGCQDVFENRFGEMRQYLLQQGIERVITACPNCYNVFSTYGHPLETESVYEMLLKSDLAQGTDVTGETVVSIHDPCVLRGETQIQEAVRWLAQKIGLSVIEMPHSGRRTLCCGEGGAVGCVDRGLPKAWRKRRQEEIRGSRLFTYCAGCTNFLQGAAPVSHILDAVFDPKAPLTGKSPVSSAPFTYLNRLRLKSRLKKAAPAAVTRERHAPAPAGRNTGNRRKMMLLAALAAAVIGLHASGAVQHIDQQALRQWVADWGFLAPLIYILFYTIAPVLFLPGLPVTIAGGILFGPLWGVVYAIVGATAGACAAFLIARYAARDWVAAKLKNQRWRNLDKGAADHGWKIVAVTRLVPLFPFNLLNYAFGLTRIRFWEYAVTSFFCMLPACIAYIVFSSSLIGVLKGRIPLEFILGGALIALISAIPIIYRRRKKVGEKNAFS